MNEAEANYWTAKKGELGIQTAIRQSNEYIYSSVCGRKIPRSNGSGEGLNLLSNLCVVHPHAS